MPILNGLILAAIGLFWAAMFYVLRERGGVWGQWAMSAELTGAGDNLVDAAYGLLAAAVSCLPPALGVPYSISAGPILAVVSGAAIIATMLTRRVWPNQRVHIASAGVAFGGLMAAGSLLEFHLGNRLMGILAPLTLAPAALQALLAIQPRGLLKVLPRPIQRLQSWLASGSRVEWLTAYLETAWLAVSVLRAR